MTQQPTNKLPLLLNNAKNNNIDYAHQERVLLVPPTTTKTTTNHLDHQHHYYDSSSRSSNTKSSNSGGIWNVRLETYSEFTNDSFMNPFNKEIRILLQELFPSVSKLLIQVGSKSSSSFPTWNPLDIIPTISNSNSFLGPSGVHILVEVDVTTTASTSSIVVFDFDLLLNELKQRKLLAAPISDGIINVIKNNYKKEEGIIVDQYELFLPTNTASMSADSMSQYFTKLSPHNKCLLATNGTALSNVLFGGSMFDGKRHQNIMNSASDPTTTTTTTTTPVIADMTRSRRSFWLELTSNNNNNNKWYSISQGIQYSIPLSLNKFETTKRSVSYDIQQYLSTWSKWVLPGNGDDDTILSTSCPIIEQDRNTNKNIQVLLVDRKKKMKGEEEKDKKIQQDETNNKNKYHNQFYNIIPIDEYNEQHHQQHHHHWFSSSSSTTTHDEEEEINSSTSSDGDSTSSKSFWSIAKAIRRPHGMANNGRIQLEVINDHPLCSIQIQLRDLIPSYISPSWQTLHVYTTKNNNYYDRNDNNYIKNELLEIEEQNNNNNKDNTTIPSSSSYVPPSPPKVIVDWNTKNMQQQQKHYPHGSLMDMKQMISLNVETILEPKTSLFVSLDYEPTLLSFNDFPGDPNRGMELIPSIVTINTTTTLYSNSLLLLPPIPDMSMPFNVISLTSSLYAYVFGSIIALIVKKSCDKIKYKLHPELKPKSKLIQLKEKLIKKFKFNKTSSKTTLQQEQEQQEEAQTTTIKATKSVTFTDNNNDGKQQVINTSANTTNTTTTNTTMSSKTKDDNDNDNDDDESQQESKTKKKKKKKKERKYRVVIETVNTDKFDTTTDDGNVKEIEKQTTK